ncbi:hypothetical protein BHE74_00002257 [Ensete ventricosum]|nr:hypothetical protein GW17_00052745 [Ensete ventricosum]RWW88842.1 hypothetical protein BHE74_00002257 [Ensete ventricosum]
MEPPVSIPSSPAGEESREVEVEEPMVAAPVEEEVNAHWRGWREQREPWPRKSSGVMLEGYVDAADGGDRASGGVARTKSLTDEDLEELKGCLDLGFGFSYEEIPELCNTLPALELCYSMSQRFLDEQQQQQQLSLDRSSSGESMDLCPSPSSPPIANWRISSPGKLGALPDKPRILNIIWSASKSLFGVVNNFSPVNMELAPAKKHSACSGIENRTLPADSLTIALGITMRAVAIIRIISQISTG